MAGFTLSDILGDINSIVVQDPSTPTGTDLSVQVNLINQSLFEWSNNYQWKQLRVNGFKPSVQLSQTSIGLPDNFKKLMSRPFRMDLSTDNDYEEIRPEESYIKQSLDPNSRYCFVGGDRAIGQYLYIWPALPSGASLMFDYQMFPSSMATLQDVCVCPSRSYMLKRTISKIYEARSDSRFPQFKSEADESLAHMMEEEASLSGAFTNRTRNQLDMQNFKIGREG